MCNQVLKNLEKYGIIKVRVDNLCKTKGMVYNGQASCNKNIIFIAKFNYSI